MNGQLVTNEKNNPLALALQEIESEKMDVNTEGSTLETMAIPQIKKAEDDLADIDFGADNLAMQRKRSREESRNSIAEDEVHVEKHIKEYKPWFLQKHPTGKVERPVGANQTTPIEQAKILDTEPEVKQDRLEDKNKIIAGEFTQEVSEESGVAPAQIIDISDKVKREEPAPDGASLSTEFGLDQKSDSASIESKTRVQEMASRTEPTIPQKTEASIPVNETPSVSATSNTISADFIAPSQEKRSLRSLFSGLIPKGNADSKSFSSLDLAARDRSKKTQGDKVEKLDSAA